MREKRTNFRQLVGAQREEAPVIDGERDVDVSRMSIFQRQKIQINVQTGFVPVIARARLDFAEFLDELQFLCVLLADPVAFLIGGVVQVDPNRAGRQLGAQLGAQDVDRLEGRTVLEVPVDPAVTGAQMLDVGADRVD